MEFASQGTLTDLINRQINAGVNFDNLSLKDMFRQLAYGMKSINSVLVHRDIKPDNILIIDNKLKISDFGISKIAGEDTRTMSFKGFGTSKYVAPEAWNNDKNTIQMDIYSMGIIFYELATLNYPYDVGIARDVIEIREAHLLKTPKSIVKYNPSITASIESIILRMIEKPVQKRYTNWDDIISALELEISENEPLREIIELATRKRNSVDLEIQSRELKKSKQEQEKDDFCKLIRSQFEMTVFDPIRQFSEKFNIEYQGVQKIGISEPSALNNNHIFNFGIMTPSRRKIIISVEAILPENHNRKVQVDRIFRSEGYRNENYIPKCKNRDILAWGQVNSENNKGMNILLLKNDDMIYGDWFIMTNTNSGFAREKRPEPFGFKIDELPKEIEYVNSTHIYNSEIKPFDIMNILSFISDYI